MKKFKITYWIATSLIFILDGVIPALTSNSELAKQGISHLGYPDHFRIMLTFFKVTGALGLMLPFVKGRVKEWVYAGFAFNFTCAAISNTVVDGFGGSTFFPLVALAILALSYFCYHKIQDTAPVKTLAAQTA